MESFPNSEKKSESVSESLKEMPQQKEPENLESLLPEKSVKTEEDKNKLESVRSELGISDPEKIEEESKSYSIIIKPKIQWLIPQDGILSDHPFDKIRAAFRGLTRAGKEELRMRKEMERQFRESQERYPIKYFDYTKGAGV